MIYLFQAELTFHLALLRYCHLSDSFIVCVYMCVCVLVARPLVPPLLTFYDWLISVFVINYALHFARLTSICPACLPPSLLYDICFNYFNEIFTWYLVSFWNYTNFNLLQVIYDIFNYSFFHSFIEIQNSFVFICPTTEAHLNNYFPVIHGRKSKQIMRLKVKCWNG